MSSNKKPKTDDGAFTKVKEYLLACPDVPSNHPAILAALRGLEHEEQRRARDAKLQQKFAKAEQVKTPGMLAVSAAESTGTDTDLEVIDHEPQEPRSRTSPNPAGDLPDDWHQVPPEIESNADNSAATLGEALAQATVQSLSQHHVQVQKPWQALAVALHSTLRSKLLDFRCTGKEEEQSAPGGFAPPVRELSETQFLPSNTWSNPSHIALRYRKAGTGAMVLTVTEIRGENNEASITVAFGSSQSTESAAEPLQFKIAEHVNLESWNRASNGGKAIPPSLHYKHLSTFLALFCQRFDVGTIQDSNDASVTNEAESLPYVDRSIAALPRPDPASALPTTIPPPYHRPVEPWMREQHQTPTIDSAFGGLRVPGRGDFSGDLMPGGLQVDPLHGGNLMGPGHPMFGAGGVGPHGMTPRFDPFGPQQPDMGSTRGGGRGSGGNPNPDHMRPPNNLNNNMFM